LTVDQVLKLGDLAKQFSREKLSDSFLVRTCWEDAGGRSRMQRFYAFVQTRPGGWENNWSRMIWPALIPPLLGRKA